MIRPTSEFTRAVLERVAIVAVVVTGLAALVFGMSWLVDQTKAEDAERRERRAAECQAAGGYTVRRYNDTGRLLWIECWPEVGPRKGARDE